MACFIGTKRSFLQGLLWLYLYGFGFMVLSLEPGFLDFDNLPDTNFSCVGKVIGGYYADLETNCQMFHVCTIGQLDEPMDIRFLCLNGTVFDQETRVCERIDEVDCTKSEQFYSLNLELYGHSHSSNLEENAETEQPLIIKSTPAPTTTTSTSTTTPSPSRKPTRTPFYSTTNQNHRVSGHHFPVLDPSSSDIRFNPEEINISLHPGAPPDIRTHGPVSYYSDKKVTDGEAGTTPTPGYGFTYRREESAEYTEPPESFRIRADREYAAELRNHQAPPRFKSSTYRTDFSPSTPKLSNYQQKSSSTIRNYYVHSLKPPPPPLQQNRYGDIRTEKSPQRLQLPLPLLPTLPSLTFSSPAPFSLQQRIEQKRYTKDHIPPPRVVISASASVSDASGRKLNYSLGTIRSAQLIKPPPSSYDEYKDEDVALDPFYLDVPKVQGTRTKRQAEKKINYSDIIRNDEEALNVLKFLFEWYKNDKTNPARYTTPLDLEGISSINHELAPGESTSFEDDEIEDSNDRSNDSNAKSNEVNSKINDKPIDNDYVNNNYEPLTYNGNNFQNVYSINDHISNQKEHSSHQDADLPQQFPTQPPFEIENTLTTDKTPAIRGNRKLSELKEKPYRAKDDYDYLRTINLTPTPRTEEVDTTTASQNEFIPTITENPTITTSSVTQKTIVEVFTTITEEEKFIQTSTTPMPRIKHRRGKLKFKDISNEEIVYRRKKIDRNRSSERPRYTESEPFSELLQSTTSSTEDLPFRNDEEVDDIEVSSSSDGRSEENASFNRVGIQLLRSGIDAAIEELDDNKTAGLLESATNFTGNQSVQSNFADEILGNRNEMMITRSSGLLESETTTPTPYIEDSKFKDLVDKEEQNIKNFEVTENPIKEENLSLDSSTELINSDKFEAKGQKLLQNSISLSKGLDYNNELLAEKFKENERNELKEEVENTKNSSAVNINKSEDDQKTKSNGDSHMKEFKANSSQIFNTSELTTVIPMENLQEFAQDPKETENYIKNSTVTSSSEQDTSRIKITDEFKIPAINSKVGVVNRIDITTKSNELLAENFKNNENYMKTNTETTTDYTYTTKQKQLNENYLDGKFETTTDEIQENTTRALLDLKRLIENIESNTNSIVIPNKNKETNITDDKFTMTGMNLVSVSVEETDTTTTEATTTGETLSTITDGLISDFNKEMNDFISKLDKTTTQIPTTLIESTTLEETTTDFTTIKPRRRGGNSTRRKPKTKQTSNYKHRFSTDSFTSRPPTRKQTIEEEIVDAFNKRNKESTTESYRYAGRKEFLTDYPLRKSLNPTRAEKPATTTPVMKRHFFFNCFGKAIDKFYADPRDCRLFHYCTQGYNKNQLLDMKFVCDFNTFFDDEKLICTKTLPKRCS